jgi:uncharacterized repeat protein (TIGR03833 family)
MDGTIRSDIQRGIKVAVVLKKDQRTGILTNGTVKDILTGSAQYPHGIKVRLESGVVGRVKKFSPNRWRGEGQILYNEEKKG